MAVKRSARKRSGSGKGLLLIVALVLVAGIMKYTDNSFIAAVREKAVTVLSGVPGTDRILAVFGGEPEPHDVSEVFGAQSSPPSQDKGYATSSGSVDDILGREKTLFPDTVDETLYPMEFEHVLPTDGTLTSSFGSRLSPTTGQPGFHYGLDIAADEGTKIGAFADGTVREVGESSYGNYLIIDHEDGFSTLYAHCSSISATVGAQVSCGEEIARVGQTGNATGPHLHLELWKDGAALNPSHYLTPL